MILQGWVCAPKVRRAKEFSKIAVLGSGIIRRAKSWGPKSPATPNPNCSMTIRKKILLFSALALGAFLAAVYLVSRFALLNGFARLESASGQENVRRIKNGFESEQTQL